MAAQVLDGEEVAAGIKAQLADRVQALIDRGVTPGLGTVLVGDDGPSANYVSMKHRDCEALGLAPDKVRLTLAGVGGAFGGREDLSMHVHACLLAMHTGSLYGANAIAALVPEALRVTAANNRLGWMRANPQH